MLIKVKGRQRNVLADMLQTLALAEVSKLEIARLAKVKTNGLAVSELTKKVSGLAISRLRKTSRCPPLEFTSMHSPIF